MPRMVWIVAVMSMMAGCAPRFRRDLVGMAPAQPGAPFSPAEADAGVAEEAPVDASAADATAGPGAGGIAVAAQGTYEVSYRVATPRAMLARLVLRCPGYVEARVVGETFAAYRERRLAALRAERERERRAVASVAGAVLGNVGVSAAAQTPNAEASAAVSVDGEAAGYAAAQQMIRDDIELPVGDIGGGIVTGSFRFAASGDGACAMAISPPAGEDATGLRGDFTILREVDLVAERQASRAAAAEGAHAVRVELTAGLVAAGADPERRDRERAERAQREERERNEREQRVLAARDERERNERAVRVHVQTAGLEARGGVVAWLSMCGGDPERRPRERREAQRRRDEAERLAVAAELRLRSERAARLRLAMDVRATLWAQLIDAGADPEQRQRRAAAALAADDARLRAADEDSRRLAAELSARDDAAFAARLAVTDELRAHGAIDRPPAPPAPPASLDERGEPPVVGAVWIEGEFVWQAGAWQWIPGGWDAAIGAVDVGVSVEVREHPHPRPAPAVDRDHRDHRDRAPAPVRPAPPRPAPKRPAPSRPAPPPPAPRTDGAIDVRDHRKP